MTAPSLSPSREAGQLSAVQAACERIAPLWPLQNFVAVNPFMGLSGVAFAEASELLERVAHRGIFMDASWYVEQLRTGAITDDDILLALYATDSPAVPANPCQWLTERLQSKQTTPQLLTVADWLDQTTGSNWAGFITDEISKWCAAWFDSCQSLWEMPWRNLSLYEAWRQAAAIDANPEIAGIPAFRRLAEQLPDSAGEVIDWALERLDLPGEITTDFLHRELMTVYGWSAYAACRDRTLNSEPLLPQLLAIRLVYDTALLRPEHCWSVQSGQTTDSGARAAKHVAQLALEHAFRSRLLRKLSQPPAPVELGRKSLQAIFCIDVRSEVYRRALESQSTAIETLGFAGFFGMPVQLADAALCPVLLSPKYTLRGRQAESSLQRFGQRIAAAWQSVRSSAAGAFPSVEASGIWFGVRMLGRLFPDHGVPEPIPSLSWLIPLAEKVDLAAGALKNMSLDASRLARVVLVCGHGSRTENNPYGSSLDCGACGGHKGDVNARFAVSLLNDREIRQCLISRGVTIPADTRFVAGLHTTTTDDVVLYDADQIPPQQRAEIERWLTAASGEARRERSRSLNIAGSLPARRLDREIRHRSVDWSETRPEWGLAGNAAFIAAPRSRTSGVNLGGRVFLHDYDAASDPDGSVLTMILTAPLVVASWINLQYYGSTVNNQLFGSGNKVLHNVVGTFGVWEGNAGDLRTGLPLQSLHDGTKWMHEPLRLQVLIEAPRGRIDRVLAANTDIRKLVANSWIHLMAKEGPSVYHWQSVSDWRCDFESQPGNVGPG